MTALSSDQKSKLIEAARQYRERAYAPYSKYKVGAALLAGSGKIYGGCNVENASYGLTICAERNAIAAAVADGERRLEAIAIVTTGNAPGSPCGACRQFMVEFNPLMHVILASDGPEERVYLAKDLLPEFFVLPQ